MNLPNLDLRSERIHQYARLDLLSIDLITVCLSVSFLNSYLNYKGLGFHSESSQSVKVNGRKFKITIEALQFCFAIIK